MTKEGNFSIVKVENKKTEDTIKTKDDFIRSTILGLYDNYRKELFEKVEGYSPSFCDWKAMIRHIDKDHDKGIDYWICTVQYWGATEEQSEFLGKFIYDSIHKTEDEKDRAQSGGLSLLDIETILSFACVMSYSYLKNSEFYEGAKRGLEDLLLSLAK